MGMGAIRVLVVDDQTLFSRGLIAQLAGDASEAHRLAVDSQPDVILLDNHMPGVNGIDALAGFKAAAPNAHVLMLTVSEDERDLAEALRGDTRGSLLKTMDSDMLAPGRAQGRARTAIRSTACRRESARSWPTLRGAPATRKCRVTWALPRPR